MADDSAKESGLPHPSPHIIHQDVLVHRKTSSSSAESRLGRLLKKINRFFNSEPPQHIETKLEGRIHQLQTDISKSVNKLLYLKVELEKEIDPHLISLIQTIVEPLIKEINRVQKSLEKHESVAQQVKESKKLSEWIEKAKKWIELCSKRHMEKEALLNAVVDHAIQEFHATIDKDLQVIQDYLNHTMERIKIDEFQKNKLKEELEPELSQHLIELIMLKNQPQDLSIESLQLWRAEADLSRENCFSSALYTIDVLSDQAAPGHSIDVKNDPYNMEIDGNLTLLEQKITELTMDVEDFENNQNKELKRICMDQAIDLEQEAHLLNSDLRLDHEDVERVQKSMEALSLLQRRLS